MTDAPTGGDPTTEPDPIPGEGDPVATGPKGGGEWPDKDTPPTGPAPGTEPGIAAAIDADRADDTGPATETNVEELYGDGDERAAVATMPEDERDRLLGDDAPSASD